MNTHKIRQEQISALADGELANAEMDAVLHALRQSEDHDSWNLYHQIGDVLRSDEMAQPLSAGFAARMAARLEAEPAHRLPEQAHSVATREWSITGMLRRFMVPGAIGAAVASAALVIAPQALMQTAEAPVDTTVTVAAVSEPTAPVGVAAVSHGAVIPAATSEKIVAMSTAQQQDMAIVQESDIVRDPRIDQYLMAHQRFSPSVYRTAQYARSATFAADSEK